MVSHSKCAWQKYSHCPGFIARFVLSFASVEYISKDQSTGGKMYFEFIQITVQVHNMQVICIVFIARIYIKQDKLLHMTRK